MEGLVKCLSSFIFNCLCALINNHFASKPTGFLVVSFSFGSNTVSRSEGLCALCSVCKRHQADRYLVTSEILLLVRNEVGIVAK